MWLSVPFGIIITLICFSGAMLVFENEVNELMWPELYFVKQVEAAPLPVDQLLERWLPRCPTMFLCQVSAFPLIRNALIR